MSSTRKIRCTDCGEAVPYGRLSCPSCGTLLASVAGGVRHNTAAAHAAPGADPVDGADDLAAEAAAATAAMTARAVEAAPVASATPVQAAAPTSVSATSTATSHEAPMLQPREPKRTAPRAPAQRTASSRTLVPTTVVRTMTAVLAPAASPAAVTASVGAAAPGGVTSWAAASAPMAADDVVDPTGAPAASHPGFFDLDHLDLARVRAGLEWATAIGAGLVAVSLLLPWSRSVIGSAGVNTYFDSWGVAGPAHVLVLIWAIALVGAAIIPNRIPTWITRAVAPLTLGVFVLGLAWPYAIGPLGGQIGVVIAFMAGIVLVVTGLVGEWFTRHQAGQPPV